jgi:hypothetical protein
VKNFSGKSISWLIYSSTLVFVAVLVMAAFSYRESAYWKRMYNDKQNVQLSADEQIRNLKLLMTNSELETSLLIKDYVMIDSMLFMQRFANAELNDNLNESIRQYYQLLKKNSDLQAMLDFYQNKINDLMVELQDTRKQYADLRIIADSLQKIVVSSQYPDQKSLFTVEFMATYQLISMNASACYNGKKGVSETKKIKQTEFIQISIVSLPGIDFDLGNKTVYLRIADPQGNILPFMKDEVDLFKYQGEEILFSEKNEVNFSARNFPAMITYHPVTVLPAGIYWVYAFCDGIKIGEASFDLY